MTDVKVLTRVGIEPTETSIDSDKYQRWICDIPLRDEEGNRVYLVLPDGRLATVLEHREGDIKVDEAGIPEFKFVHDPKYADYINTPVPKMNFDGIKDK